MPFKVHFMKKAIDLAIESIHHHGGPFAALVVKDDQIVGKGYNSVTSNCDPTAHAEVVAIRDACQNLQDFQLTDCEIYTTCEPCPMCLGAIYWARPKCVYYASTKLDASQANFDDQFIYEELAIPMESRKIPMLNKMRDEASCVFDTWKSFDEKTEY